MRPLHRTAAMRDALAGFALAAMNIPQALGYAAIAGMPAVTGFYTLLGPLLAFATFGASRYLVVAADSATAAILAAGLSPLAAPGSPTYVRFAAMVALLTAGMLLVARITKLGFLADFLSQTVLTGFLTGVGFQVGIAVLGQMLGLTVHARRTVLQLMEVLQGLPQVHWPSLGLSALVVAGVLLLSRYVPKLPGPLLAVLGTIAASALWNFAGHGIAILGPVPGGLPQLGLPRLDWSDAEKLIPVAASCFVMIITQSAAIGRIYALRHNQALDENEDLTGLAAANAAAALSGTFPVNGSLTQTAMVESAGGQSQVAHVATAAAVALVLLYLTHPLQYLPRCVLGAIVFIVAIRLVKLRELRGIRRESPGEFWLALTTAAVVVLIGVEQGIVLAMVLSLLRIVQHSYHPHTAVLVRGEGGLWTLTPAVAGAESEPGLAIYRFGAPLFYANAGRFGSEILELATPHLRCILVESGAITKVDYSAARVVERLHGDLTRRGVQMVFGRVQTELRADLDRHGLTAVVGADHIFYTLHDAVAACESMLGLDSGLTSRG
jgi:sulfate permease, SulP family